MSSRRRPRAAMQLPGSRLAPLSPGPTARRLPPVTRRQVLLGAGAAGAALALGACGGGGGGRETAEVFPIFGGPVFPAGADVRAPFMLGDPQGPLPPDELPDSVEVSVTDPDGEVVIESSVLDVHREDLPRGYYPLAFTAGGPGIYSFDVRTDDLEGSGQVQVFADDEVTVLRPGQPMPNVPTSTLEDPLGLDPICTREPPCDLHAVSLEEALAAGERIALLVSTPMFCQIGVCGPILEFLIDEAPDFDLVPIHTEVYEKPGEGFDRFAPVIPALGLAHEPVLFTVDADGTVVDRLDFVFDRAELRASLERLVG